jgi:adenylate cyclase
LDITFLFADLSGFTALTEVHGDQDAADVAARFHDLAASALQEGACLVKTIGDAVMIVVQSPEAAVRTAFHLATAVEAEKDFPAVRMGLHTGTAVERAGDYFGAAVNLAARVAAYSRAGQIACTEAVAATVRASELADLQPLGLVELKNVAQPVLLFELTQPHRGVPSGEVDHVCRMHLDPTLAPARLPFQGRTFYFCSFACAQTFASHPERYLSAGK